MSKNVPIQGDNVQEAMFAEFLAVENGYGIADMQAMISNLRQAYSAENIAEQYRIFGMAGLTQMERIARRFNRLK